jgi:hypothetical protein
VKNVLVPNKAAVANKADVSLVVSAPVSKVDANLASRADAIQNLVIKVSRVNKAAANLDSKANRANKAAVIQSRKS